LEDAAFLFSSTSIGIAEELSLGSWVKAQRHSILGMSTQQSMQQQPSPSSLEQGKPATPEIANHPGKPGRPWLWLLLVVVAGFGAYYFWAQSKSTQRSKGAASSNMRPTTAGGRRRGAGVPPVVAVKAYQGNIGVYYNGLGAVTPIYTVTVKSRVDGQLMQVYYKEGQFVHEGDLIAEIDPRPYEVQLAQAQGQLEKDQSLLENARIDLARYQQLIVKHAVPEQTLATQKATVVQDEGAVKTDQANIDSAKLNLVYCHITAPISGRVGLRLIDPGNYVQAASATPLAVITQIDPISVIFTVSEDQLPAVLRKLHAGARLRVDAYDRAMTTKLATGYVTTLDNQIDQTTGTVRLRATFDNKNGMLFANQFVNARLLIEEKRGVTLLASAAVQRNTRTTYVYFVKPDQTVTIRNVTVGTSNGNVSEITSGVSPGDEIVMTGVDKLQEGSKVQAHIENTPEPQGANP
jgi:multidrug efflux system membrane fusion protein